MSIYGRGSTGDPYIDEWCMNNGILPCSVANYGTTSLIRDCVGDKHPQRKRQREEALIKALRSGKSFNHDDLHYTKFGD